MSRAPLDSTLVEQVLKYYNVGLSSKQIGEIFGISATSVYNIFKNAGLPRQYTAKQLEILRYRQEGLCCVEIAERMNMDGKNVRRYVAILGMPFTEEEKERSIRLGKEKSILTQHGSTEDRIQHNIDFIAEKHPKWEYISGWMSSDGFMELRCKSCGNKVKKSAVSVRKGRPLRCPFCEKAQREETRLQKEKQREKVRKSKEHKFWEQSFTQMAVSFCPVCNSAFFDSRKYCSSACAKRFLNSRNKDKRLRRLRDKQIDKDITLESLFDRDGGKCWICGGSCDFKDYYRDQNENFIVGGNYPSIDHVYPLSKGGLHSWDNVRLAHHYCNTIKSNKVVSL